MVHVLLSVLRTLPPFFITVLSYLHNVCSSLLYVEAVVTSEAFVTTTFLGVSVISTNPSLTVVNVPVSAITARARLLLNCAIYQLVLRTCD